MDHLNKRIIYLDILRIIACGMIVLMHTPHPDAGVPGFVQVPIYYITAAGIGIFFMVSGALLLPTNKSSIQFLKRRFGKIAGPWLFWTLFYMALNVPTSGLTLKELDNLFVYVSSPGRHVMWFMFVLAGLYLIAPVLSSFLKAANKNEVRFYLVLWSLTLCLPWLSSLTSLNLGTSNPLYYFSGYIGYFVLGYYLHNYRPNIAKYFIFFIIFALIAKISYKLSGGERSDELFWYLSIPVMLMSVAWFALIQQKCGCTKKAIKYVVISQSNGRIYNLLKLMSDCCFGIYLVHIFVMRHFLWRIDFIVHGVGWIGQLFITWGLTMLLSFAVTFLISLLPYSQYIVGFRTERK